MDARIFALLVSLLAVLVAYSFLSWREGNFVNVLFPFVVFQVPAYYIAELVFLLLSVPRGSVFAYAICFGMYATGAVATVVGYMVAPGRWIPLLVTLPKIRIPGVQWLLLGLAYLVYLPILVEFSHLIFTPREIYSATRSGYGIPFFLSTFMAYVALILHLFNSSRRGIFSYLFLFLVTLLVYLHGSKGQLLGIGLILLYFFVFVRDVRVRLGALLGLGGVGGGLMILLFYLTLPTSQKADLIIGISNYSDYTRHGAQVVDDHDLEPQLGRLSFESSFYSMIPRALFPDKPKDFGSFWLARRYYPEWFQAETGAPAFGVGLEYADFKLFALPWYAITHFLLGVLLKIVVSRIRLAGDGGTFILLLGLLGAPLMPTGASTPFLFFYILAHIVGMFCLGAPRRRAVLAS